jgi:hypothetical protein
VATVGGLLMLLLVPAGPFRKRGASFHPKALVHVFRSKDFRAAAGGYFGHMWELYTFWAFVPVLLMLQQQYTGAGYNVSLWSFIIIGIGALSCVGGGYISQKTGSAAVAFYALLLSGCCCIVYSLVIKTGSVIFLPFMLIWGIAVIADSPQFSALVAQTAPQENRGTALTFVTCLGFAITIVSIQLLSYLFNRHQSLYTFLLLVPGPVIGVRLIRFLMKSNGRNN